MLREQNHSGQSQKAVRQKGAYGQKFIPGSAEKVAEIREMNKKVYIEIDGGVTTKNAEILRKLGVNIIVSGSTIFTSKNMRKTILINICCCVSICECCFSFV